MVALCAACHKPLVVELVHEEDDDDMEMEGSSSAKTVPDDCQLTCGDHFHWQCLLDAYTVHECPNCSSELLTTSPSGVQQLLCTLNNEGGLQEDLDILPLLTEEAYLKTYPHERKCRAFLEFCREGDLQAIIGMIQDDDDEEEEEDVMEDEAGNKAEVDILRYQDPLGDMQSALHAAVTAGSREVAWLLLLLASNLDLQQFPAEVFQEAETLGIMRDDQTGKADIRSLRDSQGRSAEQIATEMGGVWTGWPGTGRLAI
ncbi:hypothetical protein NA57DRAFT_53904 [Rhizodiscina lignyota]|uniref:Uncharacterized protein n=1 Tax=Rhizodiscina lignyota TaxID=1504668 RepID=A0A9P4MDT6_9PEZI|nr:hypothetical protein NA57DRAFT_53904 [Rhizodiscina lignyota]